VSPRGCALGIGRDPPARQFLPDTAFRPSCPLTRLLDFPKEAARMYAHDPGYQPAPDSSPDQERERRLELLPIAGR
jgi:hypothetical protein